MKYTALHSCGHSHAITLFGPGKERDRKLAWMKTIPCGDCLKEITLERAEDQIVARDLPELQGSEKQIEWATRCRYHSLLLIDRVLADAEHKPDRLPIPAEMKLPGESDPLLGELLNYFYKEDRSLFWIDHGKDAQDADRRIIRDGMESNPGPTEVVARLLIAAAGLMDTPERYIHWVQSRLQTSPAAKRKAIYGATLDAHVDSARKAIRLALAGRERPYIAYSGGKDSAAVAALVLSVRPDTILHWSDDELEYPENVTVMEGMQARYGDQFVISLGWSQHAGWFTPWVDQPFWRDPLPGTLTAGMDSDDWMARRGHDVTFLGTRAEESKVRAQWLEANGPLYRAASGTGLRCCPIWDWPTDYVYQFLEREGIPLNPAYRRMDDAGVRQELRRVGPLPLVPRDTLINGWPDMLAELERRYGMRWI